jgi:hypothetical protein
MILFLLLEVASLYLSTINTEGGRRRENKGRERRKKEMGRKEKSQVPPVSHILLSLSFLSSNSMPLPL